MDTEDFPGGQVVRTLPFQCRGLQGFLVRELRSHMPRSAAKTSKKKKKKKVMQRMLIPFSRAQKAKCRLPKGSMGGL